MTKELTPSEIIAELKSRGEISIRFEDDGMIYSRHGKNTYNTWIVQNGELKCIGCRTIY